MVAASLWSLLEVTIYIAGQWEKRYDDWLFETYVAPSALTVSPFFYPTSRLYSGRLSSLLTMNDILTLVSSLKEKPLLPEHISEIVALLSVQISDVQWLCVKKAVDLYLGEKLTEHQRVILGDYLQQERIDHFIIGDDQERKKKLLVADMDNTMVVGETLDELAGQSGFKDKVAEITELAMQGEMEFSASLRARVEMLKGLEESALERTLAGIELMPGARRLVGTMAANGATCILVSGGFTCFTAPVAARLGFQHNYGNKFEIIDHRLTGNVEGNIVDHNSKLFYLEKHRRACHLTYADVLAVGDGANDLTMISVAGLGVGFHPKPLLKAKAQNNILYGDLSALLYAQGYTNF